MSVSEKILKKNDNHHACHKWALRMKAKGYGYILQYTSARQVTFTPSVGPRVAGNKSLKNLSLTLMQNVHLRHI